MSTILITGANSGIGLELVRQYCKAGWRVIACCRDVGQELKEMHDSGPQQLKIIHLDVIDQGSIDYLAEQLQDEPIDILFNNAGVNDSAEIDFDTVTEDQLLTTYKTNAVAPVMLTKALISQVAKSQYKLVVNMGTILTVTDMQTMDKHMPYRASKGGQDQLTRSMSYDLGKKGISVVTMHPGWVKTKMGGPQAPLEVEVSVKGMRKVLDDIVSFISKNPGKAIPYMFVGHNGEVIATLAKSASMAELMQRNGSPVYGVSGSDTQPSVSSDEKFDSPSLRITSTL